MQSSIGRETHAKSPESSLKRIASGVLPPNLPAHLLTPGAFSGLPTSPLMDLSSTQALLNMVRNASSINQSHIPKTPADLHTHHIQKQFLYQQQLQQQQQQQQQQQLQPQQQEPPQKYPSILSKNDSEQVASKSPDTTQRVSLKRAADASSPLDLSSSVPNKHFRISGTESDINIEDDDASVPHLSPDTPNSLIRVKSEAYATPTPHKTRFGEKESFLSWTVDDVFDFVKSIDICAEYAEVS